MYSMVTITQRANEISEKEIPIANEEQQAKEKLFANGTQIQVKPTHKIRTSKLCACVRALPRRRVPQPSITLLPHPTRDKAMKAQKAQRQNK